MRSFSLKFLIISTIITILVLASLVNATMNVKKFKKSFREEMSQRLDLEEKIFGMEKDRKAMILELQTLKAQLSKNSDELVTLRKALAQERKDKAVLKESLEKAEAQPKGAMQQ